MIQSIRLGDCCTKIGSGATPRGGKDAYFINGPFALIRSQNILNERFSWAGLAYISAAQARLLDGVAVVEGDVLLNITGDSVARVCQVDASVLPARVNQHVAVIRPDANYLDPRYLRYYLVSPTMQERMLALASSGATRNALTKGMIENLRIECPAPSKQRAIAAVLGVLDDKIELNRRMSATLEKMARSMYRSWFVDFDPVHTKARGEAPAHMDAATAALFPDSFGPDDIPTGWRKVRLKDAATILSGGTPSKQSSAFWDGDLPWVSPKIMTGVHVFDSEDRVTRAAVGSGTRLVPAGSVLVMVRGMGLHQGVRICQARREVTFNQDVKALVPTSLPASIVLFGLLDASPFLFSKVESSGHGTGKLPSDKLEEVAFNVPSARELDPLMSLLDPINDRIAACEAENGQLATLRDTLLPKLMSGDLRVRDAERQVAEAV